MHWQKVKDVFSISLLIFFLTLMITSLILLDKTQYYSSYVLMTGAIVGIVGSLFAIVVATFLVLS
jgi:hypothetical protein